MCYRANGQQASYVHTRIFRRHRVLSVRPAAPVSAQRREHGMRRGSGVAVGVTMAGQPCIPIQNSAPVVNYEKRSWLEATVVNFSNFYSLTRTRHGLWKRAFRMRGTEGVEFLQFFTHMRTRHGLWKGVSS